VPSTGLNHAVRSVRDVETTREFYENVLGFTMLTWMPGQAASFRAPGSTNDHDLGTFQIGSGADTRGGIGVSAPAAI
jgi:catechol 2,3-dioxygenase-like lactoylglutathione lyase family enzyme